MKAFILYSCEHCHRALGNLVAWGLTLPPPLVFQLVPVVATPDQIPPARAFYSARAAGGTLDSWLHFDELAFGLGDSAVPDDTWPVVAKQAGLSPQDFNRAWHSTIVRGRVMAAAKDCLDYALQTTPTLAIAGAYCVSPDDVGGDLSLMYQVANGLVSQRLTAFEGRTP